jgi:hypothetical protein
VQYSVFVRNSKLNAIEQAIGSGATLKLMSGQLPDSCTSQETGFALATVPLPNDFMERALNGQVDKAGNWGTNRASSPGIPAYFRIYDRDGVCHIQGSVGVTPLKDMQLTTMTIGSDQPFTVERFTIRDNNG